MKSIIFFLASKSIEIKILKLEHCIIAVFTCVHNSLFIEHMPHLDRKNIFFFFTTWMLIIEWIIENEQQKKLNQQNCWYSPRNRFYHPFFLHSVSFVNIIFLLYKDSEHCDVPRKCLTKLMLPATLQHASY